MFSELFFWSNIVLLCAFVLLIQVAMLVRPLLFTRQPLWKYTLTVFALMLSLSSFVSAIHATQVEQSLFVLTRLHLSPYAYMHLLAQLSDASASCMVQTCLLAIMFVLLWYVKSTSKARRVPVWVIAQDIRGQL